MNMDYYKQYEPIFGAWRIKNLIGEGSYGKVFEIEREEFGTKYKAALKAITIPKSKSDVESVIAEGMDEESVTTYFRSFVGEITNEIALMDKIKGNSNFVNYEDHIVIEHKDDIGWDILIRMELLTPLNAYLKTHSMGAKDVVKLGIDLCKALEICDKYDIIHRDIKPENIFVSDLGVFKLGDFGIARVAEKTRGASTKVGTNSYMAPEVARGEIYSSAVDQYSLGLVMYRLLNNNRLPFLPPAPAPITFSQREEANAKRYRGEAFPQPANADRELTDIILKAAAYEPMQRYAHAQDLRVALENYLMSSAEAPLPKPDAENIIQEPDEEKTTPVTPVIPNTSQSDSDDEDRTVRSPSAAESSRTVNKTEDNPFNKYSYEPVVEEKKPIAPIIIYFVVMIGLSIFSAFSDDAASEYTHSNLLLFVTSGLAIGAFIYGKKYGLKKGIIAAIGSALGIAVVYCITWAIVSWSGLYYFGESVYEVFIENLGYKSLVIFLIPLIAGIIGGMITKKE